MPHASLNNPLGSFFVELHSIDSSNNYAMAQVHAQVARHGTAYFAHEQTKGKGQRSRTWTTEKGSNIIMSIVLQPQVLQPADQFKLSACIAVAVHEFFMRYADDDTCIKWPNDIYWRDRKAAGILIENVIGTRSAGDAIGELRTKPNHPDTSWLWSVVGIGVNINQTSFSPDIPNPVSLKQITGLHFDVVALAKELCGYIDQWYKQLGEGRFEAILARYNESLYKRNQMAKLKKNNRLFEATIREVDANGRLVISHAFEERIEFGTVEWVI